MGKNPEKREGLVLRIVSREGKNLRPAESEKGKAKFYSFKNWRVEEVLTKEVFIEVDNEQVSGG